jgi:hypothetical protein
MKFKRKEHPVEAIQWTGENYDEVYTWVMSWDLADPGIACNGDELLISTFQAQMSFEKGTWVVRDIPNEFFYPASEAEFAEGYLARE